MELYDLAHTALPVTRLFRLRPLDNNRRYALVFMNLSVLVAGNLSHQTSRTLPIRAVGQAGPVKRGSLLHAV